MIVIYNIIYYISKKLYLSLILFLFLVGRESCCASQAQNIGQNQAQNIKASGGQQQSEKSLSFLPYIIDSCFTSLLYWIFDLHQKEKGWYTCKFDYATGYRTKLIKNRIYLDFFTSFPRMIIAYCRLRFLGLVMNSFSMNINVRIFETNKYFVFVIPIPMLVLIFFSVFLSCCSELYKACNMG